MNVQLEAQAAADSVNLAQHRDLTPRQQHGVEIQIDQRMFWGGLALAQERRPFQKLVLPLTLEQQAIHEEAHFWGGGRLHWQAIKSARLWNFASPGLSGLILALKLEAGCDSVKTCWRRTCTGSWVFCQTPRRPRSAWPTGTKCAL